MNFFTEGMNYIMCSSGTCCQRTCGDEVNVQENQRAQKTPGLQAGDQGLPEPQKNGKDAGQFNLVTDHQPVLPGPPEPIPPIPSDDFDPSGIPPPTPPASPRFAANRTPYRKITPPLPWTPQLFTVEVQKTATLKKVGLEADHSDSQTLKITLVKDGLIKAYNDSAEESKQIKAGDSIIEVNGVTGDCKKMLETIGREKSLRFVVKRPRSQ